MRKCALSFLVAALLVAGLTSGPTHAAPATCENGVVVADPEANRGLVIDCANLLAAKTQLDQAQGDQLETARRPSASGTASASAATRRASSRSTCVRVS